MTGEDSLWTQFENVSMADLGNGNTQIALQYSIDGSKGEAAFNYNSNTGEFTLIENDCEDKPDLQITGPVLLYRPDQIKIT